MNYLTCAAAILSVLIQEWYLMVAAAKRLSIEEVSPSGSTREKMREMCWRGSELVSWCGGEQKREGRKEGEKKDLQKIFRMTCQHMTTMPISNNNNHTFTHTPIN